MAHVKGWRFSVILTLASGLTSCMDYAYQNESDRMELWSGETQAANRALQIENPWPQGASRRNHTTDGARAQKAMDAYKAGAAQGGTAAGGAASGGAAAAPASNAAQ